MVAGSLSTSLVMMDLLSEEQVYLIFTDEKCKNQSFHDMNSTWVPRT